MRVYDCVRYLEGDMEDTYTSREALDVRYILARPTHLRDRPEDHRKVGKAEKYDRQNLGPSDYREYTYKNLWTLHLAQL